MPITKATASSIAPAAKGDLVVGSATNDASVLAVGSANQVLTVDSSTSTGLKWAAPAAGGKVLQVVTTAFTATTNTTSTSYVDISGASLSITPSSTSSKILILGYFNTSVGGLNDRGGMDINILRGATQIFESVQANDYGGGTTGGYSWQRVGWSPIYLDSPSSTSSITYKFQTRMESAGYPAIKINESGDTSTITLLEIGA